MKKILFLLVLFLGTLMTMGCENKTTLNTTTIEPTTDSTTSSFTEERYFSGVSFASTPKENETLIISLEETEVGRIKQDLNPYKSSSILVDAYFTDSNGKTYYRPGYWTQDYKIYLLNTASTQDYYVFSDELKGTDSASKQGLEHFNVSFKPLSSGTYTYRFEVYLSGVFKEQLQGTFEVESAEEEYKGKVVVNDTNKRYFMYENTKESFIPVGMNCAWYSSKSRKSFDYDEWFKRMKENNSNFTRIWMASWSFGLHIGTGAKYDDFSSRLNQAARLERVLALAEEEGIYLFLTMNNHGQFSESVNPEWNINTYNQIVSKPYQFWTNVDCRTAYKDEIRYIVARYGTYDSLMAYELFNEVDWTQSSSIYDQKIKEWHDEMAKYLRSIDTYSRMITTSYKYVLGSAFSLSSIDISNIHTYDFSRYDAFSGTKNLINQNYRNYNKIVMMSEWGLNAESGGDTYSLDPEGITLYQALYGGLLQGAAGTPMTWWWDSYIHKYNLYNLYKGVGEFSKRMDLSGDITYLDTSNISTDSSLSFIGLKSGNKAYGYLYDSGYTRYNTELNNFTTTFSIPYTNGSYEVTLMNPRTGDVIKTFNISVKSGNLSFETGTFTRDLAIIIN